MKTKYSGFTLIEVVVVMGVIAVILPAIFSMIFGILRQQVKLHKMTVVKREGDYALTYLKNIIQTRTVNIYDDPARPAGSEVCNSPGVPSSNPLYFFEEDGTYSYFLLDSRPEPNGPDRLVLMQETTGGNAVDLTSSEVTIEPTSFDITCELFSTFSTPLVTLKYTVLAYPPPLLAEERSEIHFQTRVKMRKHSLFPNP